MSRSSRLLFAAILLAVGGIIGISLNELQGQAPGTAPAPVPAPKDITSYRDLVKQCMPAVVSLESKVVKKKDTKKGREKDSGGLGGRGQDKSTLPGDDERPDKSDRSDERLGGGSGAIISADGVIVTNYHVVEGATLVEVTMSDGRRYEAKDIRRDPKTDLAILRIKADKPLPFLTFADSDTIEIGDRVLAIGSPFGLSGTVTNGIISAKGRSNVRLSQYEDFLQTDAAINPGNSGGPLITMDGKIVGINTAIRSETGGSMGIAFAISANLAREVTRQLLETGTVKRGYLGVAVRELDPNVAERLGVTTGGVLVTKVYGDTPAEKAGMKSGDVIVSIGNANLRDPAAMPRTIAMLPLNKPVEIKILRDGKPMTLNVTILEQPEEFGQDRYGGGPLTKGQALDIGGGITIMELTDDLAKQFGYDKGTRGFVVSAVARDSAGAKAGLTRGMIVQKIDETTITTADKALKAMNSASKEKGALFQIAKPNGEIDFVIVSVK